MEQCRDLWSRQRLRDTVAEMVFESRWLALLLLLALLGAAGCGDDDADDAGSTDDATTSATTTGGDGDGDGDSMTPQSCLDAVGQDSTTYVENEIFERSCSFSSCHDSDAPAAGLDLTAGTAVAALVGVPSMATGDVLVAPGDPSGSYLMVVMDHVSAMDDQGRPGRLEGDLPTQGTMPLAQPLLCQEKRDAVAAWISGLSL